MINRIGWLAHAIQDHRNNFRFPAREVSFRIVLREMARTGHRFVPQQTAHGVELLQPNKDNGNPAIVVTLHSPLSGSLLKLYETLEIPSTTIIRDPDKVQKNAELLGMKGKIDHVNLTPDCLFSIRRKLAAGRLVSVCVDFVSKQKDGASDMMISPSLFEFAKMTGSPIVYARVGVSNDANIEITFASPALDPAISSPDELSHDFIRWLTTHHGDQRRFSVGKWLPGKPEHAPASAQ